MEYQYARRMGQVRPSTIRQILKVTEQPDMISFAGGLPAPECFPVAEVAQSAARVLAEAGAQALQYAVTEGYGPLREKFAAEMKTRGVVCSTENILITTGSQQALDLIGKVFLDPGDCVLTESPTYLAAIQAFQSYEVRFASAPTDVNGLDTDQLEEVIVRERPKLIYTIPNFQNPTGITQSAERRVKLYELAARYGVLVVEDDPYGKLRYAGQDIAPIKSHDRDGNVIYVSTVSKTVTPGLRLGWVVAAEPVLNKLVVAKQAADLHASNLDQRIVERYLTDFDNNAHVEKIRAVYGSRFSCMNACLTEFMPEGFEWTHPEGGMFLWVTCPETVNTWDLMKAAVQRNVLFVPGADFFPDGSGHRYLRLNFSNASEAMIRTGIERLAEVAGQFAVVPA
ncbi:PLP-dependent aminotransferase family protein [Telmatobacter bradus]|uniref:aminotransferase-like domain-containing protein n=1 Tax=Telmatobacter bradus TaxID=474953 RepID=UPI003B42DDDA